jgi:hypothetical protein
LCGIVGFALIAGCAQTPVPPVQKAPAPTPLEPVACIRTPDGWVQEHNAIHQLVASRDGYLVQFIFVAARTNFDAFPDINKGADQSMLPSQLAELHIANLKAGSDEKVEVLENEPAEVGGLAGYRLQLRFFDGRGLEFKAFVYGAADEHYFYRLAYQAPVLYFFDRDLPAFEAMVKSFQRGSPPPREPGWAIVSLDAIAGQ